MYSKWSFFHQLLRPLVPPPLSSPPNPLSERRVSEKPLLLGSSVNRGNGAATLAQTRRLESHAGAYHAGAYTCFSLYDTFATKGNYRDWREIRKGVIKGMHVSIRRYGLLTREPVEKVLQGVREGFILLSSEINQDSWPITRWIAGVARSLR